MPEFEWLDGGVTAVPGNVHEVPGPRARDTMAAMADDLSAVLEPAEPVRLATGFVHTDDEDFANANSYSANPAWITDAQRIVSSGANTTLNLARVR